MTNPTCAWCGGPLPTRSGPGRPRRYCRRSCRQRAYEDRRRRADEDQAAAQVAAARTRLAELVDRADELALAVADVRRTPPEDPADLAWALRWLLEAAEPVVAASRRRPGEREGPRSPSRR